MSDDPGEAPMLPRLRLPLILLTAALVLLAGPANAAGAGEAPVIPIADPEPSEAPKAPAKETPPVEDAAPAPPEESPGALDRLTAASAAVVASVATAAGAIGSGVADVAAGIGAAFGATVDTIVRAAAAVGSALMAAGIGIGRGITWTAQLIGDAAVGTYAFVAAGAIMIIDAPAAFFGWYASLPPGGQRAVTYTAAGTAAAGGSVGLWTLLRRLGALGFLAPLYTRIQRGDALMNKQRASIFAHVQTNPGAHPTAIKETLGIGWGTTVYHLDRLQELGLVTHRKTGQNKCYFVNGGVTREDQASISALKNDTASAIATYLRDHPGATQKEVSGATGISAALVSWHVKRLSQAGVVAKERVGKATALTLVAYAGLAAPR